jgi:DNA sulfur modification protein DndC
MDYITQILEGLRDAYLGDDKPWIVGFSGGKDSTMLVELIYYMLKEIKPNRRHKHIYVLSSDTRIENPFISSRIRSELDVISHSAVMDSLPISTHIVYPKLNDTFWVNIIGRGYPTPTIHFRWCTDRLKIRPTNNFIKTLVEASGSVIIILGVRKEESNIRSRVINAKKIENQRFRPHQTLSKAWIYAPIENLTSNEVWVYLIDEPKPWGGDNWELIKLYKNASGGECPLVIDNSTSPCGQNRFGCWACTVVKHDRSLQSLVKRNFYKLKPLLEFRNHLKKIRSEPGMRQKLRRNGRIAYDRSGKQIEGIGPFKHEVRQDLLKRLLMAQNESGFCLIEGDELAAIKYIWSREEETQLCVDSVYHIWQNVNKETAMSNIPKDDYDELLKEDELLKSVCEELGSSFEMIRRLRDVEEEFGHLKRRHGLPEELRDIIRQESRPITND